MTVWQFADLFPVFAALITCIVDFNDICDPKWHLKCPEEFSLPPFISPSSDFFLFLKHFFVCSPLQSPPWHDTVCKTKVMLRRQTFHCQHSLHACATQKYVIQVLL